MQVGCKEAKGRLMQSAEQFWAGRETDQVGMDQGAHLLSSDGGVVTGEGKGGREIPLHWT